jgi:hypothetical protein
MSFWCSVFFLYIKHVKNFDLRFLNKSRGLRNRYFRMKKGPLELWSHDIMEATVMSSQSTHCKTTNHSCILLGKLLSLCNLFPRIFCANIVVLHSKCSKLQSCVRGRFVPVTCRCCTMFVVRANPMACVVARRTATNRNVALKRD